MCRDVVDGAIATQAMAGVDGRDFFSLRDEPDDYIADIEGGVDGMRFAWSDDMGYGAQHAARPPFFVVTHLPPADVRRELDFRFVADVPTANEQAKAVARNKDVLRNGAGRDNRPNLRPRAPGAQNRQAHPARRAQAGGAPGAVGGVPRRREEDIAGGETGGGQARAGGVADGVPGRPAAQATGRRGHAAPYRRGRCAPAGRAGHR